MFEEQASGAGLTTDPLRRFIEALPCLVDDVCDAERIDQIRVVRPDLVFAELIARIA
jgi:hypothetical protein